MTKDHPPSQLFTVRVWQEKQGQDQVEIRFQIKHVLSGETRLFREGEPLLLYLLAKLEGDQQNR